MLLHLRVLLRDWYKSLLHLSVPYDSQWNSADKLCLSREHLLDGVCVHSL